MSYTIQYSPESAKRYPKRRRQRRSSLPYFVLIALLLITYAAFRTNIKNALQPKDNTVAVEAFSGLVESVESGNSIKNALLTFCSEIIENGR